MTEGVEEGREGVSPDGDGVKFYPVGQLVVAARDGVVVGTEMLWGESVEDPGQAASLLSALMQGMMDARWVLRQSTRVGKREQAN